MPRPLLFRLFVALALPALLALNGCAPAKITASWKAPGYERGEIRSFLVIGVSKNETARRAFEDAMTDRLEQYGLAAEPSYRTVSLDEVPDQQNMTAWVENRDADGVIISRIVETRTERIVTPGRVTVYDDWPYYWRRSHWSGIDPYRGWYPYYRRSYEIIHEPARVSHVRIVTIETTLYSVKTDRPVWSVRAEMDAGERMDESRIDRFAGQLIDNMVESGVI